MSIFSLIVAMTPDRVIGLHNRLPWYLPADLKHFRTVTWGKPIVMGRKTYDSIGKPLPGRLNIVLSHNPHLQLDGCQIIHSHQEVIALQQHYEEIMVIGGAAIYSTFLPYAQRLYITWVHAHIEGDVFFPHFQLEKWKTLEKQEYYADSKNNYDYTFQVLSTS